MRSNSGLTLLEIVLAVLILAIGIIGAGALQANGLRATRTSQIVQDLDAVARSAITTLRHEYANGPGMEISESECPADIDGFCTFSAVPCSFSGSELVCSAGRSPIDAWAITVTAENQAHEVGFNTIVIADGAGLP